MNRDSHRQRLIALNQELGLARGHICRMAPSIDDDWPESRRTAKSIGRELGVPTRSVRTARRTLAIADEIAAREEDRARELGARIVTTIDSEYPDLLHEIPLPPPVLYVLGELPDRPAVSIVGSRKPDHYGREAAHFFGHHLALRGVNVVSGFARGVDEAAHRGALAADDGKTVAVLGCGLDVPYPTGRERLVVAVRRQGALVTEFPMGTQPLARNFPVRNRIIAALGRATLVIQAAPRSGSLITARYALELGREVFALPGRIFDETALGPNALLRDGASIALHPDDLVGGSPDAPAGAVDDPEPPLSRSGAAVWRALSLTDGTTPNALAERLETPIDRILTTLLDLELAGWVQRHPGPSYTRRRR